MSKDSSREPLTGHGKLHRSEQEFSPHRPTSKIEPRQVDVLSHDTGIRTAGDGLKSPARIWHFSPRILWRLLHACAECDGNASIQKTTDPPQSVLPFLTEFDSGMRSVTFPVSRTALSLFLSSTPASHLHSHILNDTNYSNRRVGAGELESTAAMLSSASIPIAVLVSTVALPK